MRSRRLVADALGECLNSARPACAWMASAVHPALPELIHRTTTSTNHRTSANCLPLRERVAIRSSVVHPLSPALFRRGRGRRRARSGLVGTAWAGGAYRWVDARQEPDPGRQTPQQGRPLPLGEMGWSRVLGIGTGRAGGAYRWVAARQEPDPGRQTPQQGCPLPLGKKWGGRACSGLAQAGLAVLIDWSLHNRSRSQARDTAATLPSPLAGEGPGERGRDDRRCVAKATPGSSSARRSAPGRGTSAHRHHAGRLRPPGRGRAGW